MNQEQPDQQQQQQQPQSEQDDSPRQRKPIHTYHCPYCNQLLLASTHNIPSTASQLQNQSTSLPRRRSPALDEAIIVPLKSTSTSSTTDTTTIVEEDEGNEGEVDAGGIQDSYSILLSSCVRDKVPMVVRREDGFERRSCLRCGRCKVVMGYFLDHQGRGEVEEDVLYVLPGALVRTEELGGQDERDRDQTWRKWLDLEVKS
ncbi:hypothetical protein VTN49DRAFT_4284 [Thermomyces lanuginosus]|uniref:uncharacterized protein n=1 Tax=Thermomyces lanuginosus TaxID=5541 RepID=UPI00374346A4